MLYIYGTATWIPSIYPSHVSIHTIHGSYGIYLPFFELSLPTEILPELYSDIVSDILSDIHSDIQNLAYYPASFSGPAAPTEPGYELPAGDHIGYDLDVGIKSNGRHVAGEEICKSM